MIRTLFCLSVALGLCVAPAATATAQTARRLERVAGGERRLALVIGNDTYAHASSLRNARADAQAVAAELTSAGFEVALYTDLDRRGMNRALDDFVARLSAGAIAVFFYAGHGIQLQNTNYLIPTDMAPERPSDVANDAIDLSQALEKITSASPAFSLAIIDACRDNPFAVAGRSLGLGRGLAAPTSAPKGFMVVYSAGTNQTALDRLGEGDRSPNGLFTRELLSVMRRPGLRVQDAISEVKLSVISQAREVGHEQTPAIYDQSTGSFYFRPPLPDAAQAPQRLATPPGDLAGSSMVEVEYWKSVQQVGSVDAYRKYLERYARGQFVEIAELQIQKLTAAATPPAPAPRPIRADAPAREVAIVPSFRAPVQHSKFGMPTGILTADAQGVRFVENGKDDYSFRLFWAEIGRVCVNERSVLGIKSVELRIGVREKGRDNLKEYTLLAETSRKGGIKADYGADAPAALDLLRAFAALKEAGFAGLATAEIRPVCNAK